MIARTESDERKALLGLLNEEQMSHWRSVRWLLNWDLRAEGRTTVLALAFIAEANERKGTRIELFDHHPTEHATGHVLLPVIDALLDKLKTDSPEWRAKEFVMSRNPYALTRTR